MRADLALSRFSFAPALGATARRELGALPTVRVGRGQRLLRRGESAGGAFLVVRGSLRAYHVTPQGRETTLYRVGAGGTCVLALASALGDDHYPAWVSATDEGATFVRVPAALLRRLLDDEPALRRFFFDVLASRVFDLMRALEELGSESVEVRVARLLVRRMDEGGCVHATQAALAAELFTAREVVSRALQSLVRRRVVRTGRGVVEVLDRRAIEQLASGNYPARTLR